MGGNFQVDTTFMIRSDSGFQIESGERNCALISLCGNAQRSRIDGIVMSLKPFAIPEHEYR